MFPIDRYKFYTTPDGKVIAVSSYAGCTVKGISKCDPRDTFSLEKGKELAAARCNEKIAKKRVDRAKKKLVEAGEQYEQAEHYYDQMRQYLDDAQDDLDVATADVEKLLKEM